MVTLNIILVYRECSQIVDGKARLTVDEFEHTMCKGIQGTDWDNSKQNISLFQTYYSVFQRSEHPLSRLALGTLQSKSHSLMH